jgi:hypothetical protein
VQDATRSRAANNTRRKTTALPRLHALLASLAIHLVLVALAFSTASGRMMSSGGASGGPSGPVFTVTVVRLSPAPGAARETDPERLSILAKLHPAAVGEAMPVGPTRRNADVAALVDQVQAQSKSTPQAPRPEPRADRQGARLPSPALVSASQRVVYDGRRDADGDAASRSAGALWGAIEPCWRNLGARGRVPVVLEVALDGAGGLRTPPTVVRNVNALITEPRLQAEASALAAVAACAPHGNLALAGKTYHLEFPGAP